MLDPYGFNNKNMPRAYRELEKLSQEIANHAHGKFEPLPCKGSCSGPFPPSAGNPPNLDIHNAYVDNLHSRSLRTFSEIFLKETTAGRLDILDEPDFLEFISHQTLGLYIGPLLPEDNGIFETVLKEVSGDVRVFDKFVSTYRHHFSSNQIDMLLVAFKDLLEHPNPWGRPMKPPSSASSILVWRQNLLRQGLTGFFGCLQASSETLEELACLIPREDYERILMFRIHPEPGKVFITPLGFNFPASIIPQIHPEFFKEQLESRGLDGAVINMLIDSWEGDLDSLFEAAQSLSAEKLES